jgi:AraC-like DNA-binding protein
MVDPQQATRRFGLPGCCHFRVLWFAGMSTSIREPVSHLARYVACFWERSAVRETIVERVLPSGTAELVITLGERSSACVVTASGEIVLPRVTLSGMRTEPFIGRLAAGAIVVGVHFWPAGLRAFVSGPADQLLNVFVDAHAIWGRTVTELRERLLQCSDTAARFTQLESFLTSRLVGAYTPPLTVTYALNKLSRSPKATIKKIVEATGFSHRSFIQSFRRETGMGPKQFMRIARLQALTAGIRNTPQPVDWARMSVAYGYSDQSHMVREFRQLFGVAPTEYVRSQTPGLNHLALGSVKNIQDEKLF